MIPFFTHLSFRWTVSLNKWLGSVPSYKHVLQNGMFPFGGVCPLHIILNVSKPFVLTKMHPTTWVYRFTDKMSKSQTPNGQNVERPNVEWDTMPNAKMSNKTKCLTDKMSNGTKCRRDKMSKVIKAEWDKTSNGTKRRIEITSNGTKCRMLKCRMGQNDEC